MDAPATETIRISSESGQFSYEDLEQSIPARFEQQARLHPGRIAIEDGESILTYSDLNRLANRIAWAVLAARGPGSEPVALLAGNGVPATAAMLGVLKAGKFYVPLDASQPMARLALILKVSRPGLLLADAERMEQAAALAKSAELAGIPLRNLDTLPPDLGEENPGVAIAPSDLAYVLFTSGSTGQPKGVMQNHRYVLHLTMVYTGTGQIASADRVALLYSPSFAGAVRDIYCSLLNGAAILPFDVKREGLTRLAAWLRQKRITVFFAVATMFRHFCRLLTGEDRFPAVRLIELGSETVHAGDVRLYQRHFGADCRMIVNLGGSEISPICQFPVDAGTRLEGGAVPAGYPAADVDLLLLDPDGNPVPTGTPGEIVVRSRYLFSGYWGRPELTAAAFLPDPEGGRPLFRTGDLGRILPDGCLLHLGRRDFQVKIRGYRVETAEVEDFFTATGLVRDAAVSLWRDAGGEPSLAAWLVPARPDAPPTAGELRALAQASLPDYMVPASFVLMETLPTTASGKLDRLALPDPRLAGPQPGMDADAPRTALELRLHEMWAELLGRERIGIHENFFDLGGHSLLAMQVVARIATGFHVLLHANCLFEAPTLAQLAEAVEHARRMESDEAIVPAPRGGPAPLSPAQQRLWVLARMQAAGEVFNMVRTFQLDGPLDLWVLAKALAGIGSRHDNLRASFPIANGEPVQTIAPSYASVLSIVDGQDVPEAQFDLERGPLWSVRVVRLSQTRHLLHLAIHHLISDDWSVQVLLRELSERYSALVAGRDAEPAELAVQYADYARWQRRWLTGERLTQQLAYWLEQLRGAPPLLDLPLDRPRRAAESFHAGSARLRLDSELTARLRLLSRESETTLFVTLLAAYALLLSRYGNPEDVVIGTVAANRYPVETEPLIGFFVNTLALRLRWREGAAFREMQACAHRAAVGGYAHPDVPFDRIVEALQPDRNTPHSPVFQTLFVLQNVPKQELALQGLAATPVDLGRPSAGATFDLTLSLQETGGELRGALEFNAALFDAATVERMAAHFETLLRAIVENPDSPAERLPMITAEERSGLLRGSAIVPRPEERCLHEWFDEQAALTPHAPAVTCQGVTWSYQELQRKSNRLGHRLRALGVGPETMVGLCVERSLDMVAAILGILKAGGAYVPLDPANPRERLGAIARDAGLRFVVAGDNVASAVPECEHLVRLSDDGRAWPGDNPRGGVTADSLAYVIYTSGSTGRPKGTLTTHRNATRLFTATEDVFRPGQRDVWTLFHSYAFDFSVCELWGALLYGGRVVVVPHGVSRDPEAFYRLLEEERVTVLNQTPSAFHHIVSLDERSPRPLNLRLVMVGGEAWDPAMLRPWFERHGDRQPQVFNVYGPTETTVFATFRPLTLADSLTAANRLGTPIPDLDIYVLDRHREPVPIGVVGEMYVGGPGLARGYLNRAELTATHFIANPFSPDPAARLYKTGDLARRLPGGSLEYVGRVDNQVKLRGYRIELGEIEAVLAAHPAVEQAAVVLRREAGGDARLVAYVTPGREWTGTQDAIADIRQLATRHLPDYMVPSAFVPMESLPLTLGGKVDRRALPAPGASSPAHSGSAANPAEEVVAAILARVLGLERLGRDDNFFEWGGHSLLAVQAVLRLREAFPVDLPIRCLFETPTPAGLARSIAAQIENGAAAVLAIERLPAGTVNAPLSFAQQQLWILDQIEGPSATYNVSCAFLLEGPLDVLALTRALGEISRRHAVLRTAVVLDGDAPVQAVDECAALRLTVREAPMPDTDLRRFLTEDSQRPFDLARAPLMRATLLVRSAGEHVLVLTLHHILADGLSLHILLNEWSSLYRAFRDGEGPPPPPLPIQYADYAAWQRQWLQGDRLEALSGYWKRQLAGAPPLLTLAADRPRPAVQAYRGGVVRFPIEEDLVRRLESLSRQTGATMFITTLAAYATLLSRWSGQDDVVIGSPVSNRDRAECQPLIGFFVDTLALRVETGGNPPFRELLARVRRMALEAYAHSALPFEQVVEAVRPARSLSYTPLFQVMFSWEPQGAEWDLPGVTATPIEADHLVAKYDLTLTMTPQGQTLRASFEYNSDLFDRTTIVQWQQQFLTLLADVANTLT
jgi:amino acid adenylation domain-containing protein